jgi:hypothetical protein
MTQPWLTGSPSAMGAEVQPRPASHPPWAPRGATPLRRTEGSGQHLDPQVGVGTREPLPAARLTVELRSVRAPLVVERREDARRKWRRTAALDQPGQRMEVHTALARQFLRESRIEAGVTQACASPCDDVGRFLPGLSLLSGNQVHVYLAHGDPSLLPTPRSRPCSLQGLPR